MARHDWDLLESANKHGLIHNPGYDFLRMVRWIAEADPQQPNLSVAPYCLPILGVIAACCSIEGYVNMIGKRIDKDWDAFVKGPIAIRTRIERIYSFLDLKVDFSQGVFKEVVDLFAARKRLVHPKFQVEYRRKRSTIPSVFEDVGSKYPPSRAEEISERTRDRLLTDSESRDVWQHRSLSIDPNVLL